MKKLYDIKSQLFDHDNPEVVFLGRKIIWKSEGLEMEADSKHVKALLTEWGMEACKPCDTPIGGEAAEVNQREGMSKGEAMLFRRGAARINYLS